MMVTESNLRADYRVITQELDDIVDPCAVDP